mmetsp:Transcript_24942/g.57712  ORF Transcript_24942/g.57712 Transcript_24942/m.57712 type:complete len:313 (-) Transcript_24942:358-1296(-)
MVGCCEFNPVVGCITRTGLDPSAYCHGGAQMTWHVSDKASQTNQKVSSVCLTAVEPHREGGRVGLEKCNPHDSKMSWMFNDVSGQIRNAYGKCLGVSSVFGISMTDCDVKDVRGDQKWVSEADGLQGLQARLKNEQDGNCISVIQGGAPATPTIFGEVKTKADFDAIVPTISVSQMPCEPSSKSEVWVLSSGLKATWTTTSTTLPPTVTTTATPTTTTTVTIATVTTVTQVTAVTASVTVAPPEVASTTSVDCETAVNGSACANNIEQVRTLIIPAGLPPCPGLTIHSTNDDIQNCLASRPDTSCKKVACPS